LPIELRRTLGIDEKDALEIYVDSEKIILKKYEPACIFCGNADDVQQMKKIGIQLDWKNDQGIRAMPVRLTSWVCLKEQQ